MEFFDFVFYYADSTGPFEFEPIDSIKVRVRRGSLLTFYNTLYIANGVACCHSVGINKYNHRNGRGMPLFSSAVRRYDILSSSAVRMYDILSSLTVRAFVLFFSIRDALAFLKSSTVAVTKIYPTPTLAMPAATPTVCRGFCSSTCIVSVFIKFARFYSWA